MADRLRGRFELVGKVIRITAGANQIDHLTKKLREYGGRVLGISGASCESLRGPTKPGQLSTFNFQLQIFVEVMQPWDPKPLQKLAKP